MHRFMSFVNGSNLFGAFKHLEVFVDDYEALFSFLFEETVKRWRTTIDGAVRPPAQQVRIYWYVVDSMDEWDLQNPRTKQHLYERFQDDREIKNRWITEAVRSLAGTGADQGKVEQTAFNLCFDDFKVWYEKKQVILNGMNRFYHAVEASTDFIEICRTGRWKVDLLRKTLAEKGVDVGFAVDLLAFQQHYDVAVLVSADVDGVPSMELLKNSGKQMAVVDFVRGPLMEGRSKSTTSRLKLTADFIVPIFEADLVKNGIATRGEVEAFPLREAGAG